MRIHVFRLFVALLFAGITHLFPVRVHSQSVDYLPADQTPVLPDTVQRLTLIHQWQSHSHSPGGIAFSPDSSYLVSAGKSVSDLNEVLRYSLRPGQPINPGENLLDLDSFTGTIRDIHFFNRGQSIALLFSGAVAMWDIDRGESTDLIRQALASDLVRTSPTTLLVASRESGVLTHWSVSGQWTDDESENNVYQSIANLMTAVQTTYPLSDIAYDARHQFLFVLSTAGQVYQYPLLSYRIGEPVLLSSMSQELPSQPVLRTNHLLTIHPEEGWIAYADAYQGITIYDYINQEAVTRFSLMESINCIAYNPQTGLLFATENTAMADVIIFDMTTRQEIRRIRTDDSIQDCAVSPDGLWFATLSPEGIISLRGIADSTD